MSRVSTIVAAAGIFALVLFGTAERPAAAQPDDGLTIVPRYNTVIATPGETVLIALVAGNRTVSTVEFFIDWTEPPAPEWNASIRGTLTNFEIRGVVLGPGETRSISVSVTVPEGVFEGDYRFDVQAKSVDGDQEVLIPLTVGVRSEAPAASTPRLPGTVFLEAPRFASLTGTNDGVFEFPVVLRNGTEEPVNLDLGADAPSGWDVGFVPSFQRAKRITSVGIDSGSGETVTVQVAPPSNAAPGRYPVRFMVTGAGEPLETRLEIGLTGPSEIRLRTPSGRLNALAVAGETTNVTTTVANTGGVSLDAVTLVAQAPDGWVVTFEPPVLNFVARGEVREVRLLVQPGQEAIPGDYRLTVAAVSETALDTVDMIVTVTQSTIWGWAGLGVVVLVLGGLTGLFLRLGRR